MTKTKPNQAPPGARIFACILAGQGITYTDRTRERHGDYVRLGFLSFGTLALDIEKDCPADLRDWITNDAAQVQDCKGGQYQTSSSGQSVTLGWALPK